MSQPLPSPPSAQRLNLPDVHSCQRSIPAQLHPSCQALVVWLGTLAHLCNPIITPLTKASTSWPAVHLTAQPVQTRKSKVVRTCCGLKPQPGSAPMHPNPTATQIWLHAPFLLGEYMKNQGPGRHKTELRIFLRTSLIICFNPN